MWYRCISCKRCPWSLDDELGSSEVYIYIVVVDDDIDLDHLGLILLIMTWIGVWKKRPESLKLVESGKGCSIKGYKNSFLPKPDIIIITIISMITIIFITVIYIIIIAIIYIIIIIDIIYIISIIDVLMLMISMQIRWRLITLNKI